MLFDVVVGPGQGGGRFVLALQCAGGARVRAFGDRGRVAAGIRDPGRLGVAAELVADPGGVDAFDVGVGCAAHGRLHRGHHTLGDGDRAAYHDEDRLGCGDDFGDGNRQCGACVDAEELEGFDHPDDEHVEGTFGENAADDQDDADDGEAVDALFDLLFDLFLGVGVPHPEVDEAGRDVIKRPRQLGEDRLRACGALPELLEFADVVGTVVADQALQLGVQAGDEVARRGRCVAARVGGVVDPACVRGRDVLLEEVGHPPR